MNNRHIQQKWSAHRLNTKAGFTLLFAVLVTSLALSIGIAIFNISLKELILSSAGRESQLAFFAADSGAECVLFWDFKHNAFATSTYQTLSCSGAGPFSVGGDGYDFPDEFTIDFPAGNCVEIEVRKHNSVTLPGCLSECTELIARGYNTCVLSDPIRVQRTIRVTY